MIRLLIGMLLAGMLLAGEALRAQTYSAFLGASVDGAAQTNAAGHACLFVEPESASFYSISCLSARGPDVRNPVYDLVQGFGRPLFTAGRFTVSALTGGGITTRPDATYGLFDGGFMLEYRLKDQMGIVGLFKGAYSPGLVGQRWVPRFGVGLRYGGR